jgi:hypothetical protein
VAQECLGWGPYSFKVGWGSAQAGGISGVVCLGQKTMPSGIPAKGVVPRGRQNEDVPAQVGPSPDQHYKCLRGEGHF